MNRPGPINALIAALCALTGLSAVLGFFAALLNRPTSDGPIAPAVFSAGFELVTLVACGFVVYAILRGARDGRAMTLLCAAGAVGAGGLLMSIAAGGELFGTPLRPLVYARGGVAALLALAAALDVIALRPAQASRLLAFGFVLLLPVAAIAYFALTGTLSARLAGVHDLARIGIAFAIFILFCGLLSAGTHQIIRAFQVALDTTQPSDQRQPANATLADKQPAN